jgi:hypothetical protein
MAIEINKKLFTLDEVYETIKLGDIMTSIHVLKCIKFELEEELDVLTENLTTSKLGVSNLISDIETQLTYLNKNIRTFETSLMIHENKILENRTVLGIKTKICLN